jgi:hypothetical protein
MGVNTMRNLLLIGASVALLGLGLTGCTASNGRVAMTETSTCGACTTSLGVVSDCSAEAKSCGEKAAECSEKAKSHCDSAASPGVVSECSEKVKSCGEKAVECSTASPGVIGEKECGSKSRTRSGCGEKKAACPFSG